MTFPILKAIGNVRPRYRLFGKLVLCGDGRKEYLPASADDALAYNRSGEVLSAELFAGRVSLPSLRLTPGHNTRQAMNYNFNLWTDFFNDRQLLALSWLRQAIRELADPAAREALLTLFSGALEFNNLFASYKGEGTGAVRHMFSHHILKPERAPIEANARETLRDLAASRRPARQGVLTAVHGTCRSAMANRAPARVARHLSVRGRFRAYRVAGRVC